MGCMTPLHADTISVPVLVTLSFSFPVSLCLSLSFCHSFCLACLLSFSFFLSSVCLRMSVCRVLCLLCFPVLSLSLFFYLSNLFITLSFIFCSCLSVSLVHDSGKVPRSLCI